MASRVSTSKGGEKKRRPKHQNNFAWVHNLNSKKTAKILAMPNQGLCSSCYEKIEWRKRYRKYKPLTQPGACRICKGRCVKAAYHMVCQPCAEEKQICAKCMQPKTIWKSLEQINGEEDAANKAALAAPMKERERRSLLRKIERQQAERADARRARRREAAEAKDKMADIIPEYRKKAAADKKAAEAAAAAASAAAASTSEAGGASTASAAGDAVASATADGAAAAAAAATIDASSSIFAAAAAPAAAIQTAAPLSNPAAGSTTGAPGTQADGGGVDGGDDEGDY